MKENVLKMMFDVIWYVGMGLTKHTKSTLRDYFTWEGKVGKWSWFKIDEISHIHIFLGKIRACHRLVVNSH